MADSFSQRHGLAGPPPGTLLRDEVPVSLRMFLVDLPHTLSGLAYEDLRQVTCKVRVRELLLEGDLGVRVET
jgi:hypothetical protein